MTALRGGFTTGACAAAAAKAAVTVLCGAAPPATIDIPMPDGSRATFPILSCRLAGSTAEASVRKDAGDDPDVTDGACVAASVAFTDDNEVRFAAGDGVGIVTKPGLSAPPGEPAINPVPRQMIRSAIREITPRGVCVTISIPGGRDLAARTFNPRLGVEGGLSVLGTTGRVRPFSVPALCDALKCALDVAAACGIVAPVLVPGNIGERAARRHLRLRPEQVIQVSNQWGFMLDHAARYRFDRLLVLGHPGKLAKLAENEWDTHSARSSTATSFVARLAAETLGAPASSSPTVEGLFESLSADQRLRLGNVLAAAVRRAITARIGPAQVLAVALINMAGDILGTDGDLAPWRPGAATKSERCRP